MIGYLVKDVLYWLVHISLLENPKYKYVCLGTVLEELIKRRFHSL